MDDSEDWQVEYLDETDCSVSSDGGPINYVETALSELNPEHHVLKLKSIFGEKTTEYHAYSPTNVGYANTKRNLDHTNQVVPRNIKGIRTYGPKYSKPEIVDSRSNFGHENHNNSGPLLPEARHSLLNKDDDGDDIESDITRWTARETKELLLAYKKYAADMIAATSYRQKRLVWNKIAAEVKMTPPRICGAYVARLKVDNMRKTYLKQLSGLGRPHWRYFSLMKDAMDTETSLKSDAVRRVGRGEDMERYTDAATENVSSFQSSTDNSAPLWFRHLAEASRKRHEDSMKIKRRLCMILESLAGR